MILFYRFLCINFWDSEQINCVNLWLGKQAIGFIFPIHYSEQINNLNLWLGKQAIGFIFPIHYSEQINNLNLWLGKQAIGFIFPIHYSELLTSLKATLRVSDLSFGSIKKEKRAHQTRFSFVILKALKPFCSHT